MCPKVWQWICSCWSKATGIVFFLKAKGWLPGLSLWLGGSNLECLGITRFTGKKNEILGNHANICKLLRFTWTMEKTGPLKPPSSLARFRFRGSSWHFGPCRSEVWPQERCHHHDSIVDAGETQQRLVLHSSVHTYKEGSRSGHVQLGPLGFSEPLFYGEPPGKSCRVARRHPDGGQRLQRLHLHSHTITYRCLDSKHHSVMCPIPPNMKSIHLSHHSCYCYYY